MTQKRLARRSVLGAGAAGAAALALGVRPEPASAQWKAAGLTGSVVHWLGTDRVNGGVLYAITQPGAGGNRTGLMKSVDAGRSWFGLERGLPAGFLPTAFATSPDDGRVVLAADQDGLYRSTSAGTTWSRVPPRLPALTAIAFDRANPRKVIAGSELEGNFESDDGGRSWRPSNRGLTRDHYGVTPGAVRLAQHPVDAKLFLMASNAGTPVFRSTDGATTWTPATTGLPQAPGTIYSVTFATGGQSPAAFLLAERGVFRSTDGGTSWHAAPGLPGTDFVALYADPDVPQSVYVATARGTLHRSTNGGASWVELMSLPRPVRSLVSWPPATTTGISLAASLSGTAGSAVGTLAAAAGEGLWQLSLRPTLPASEQQGQRGWAYYTQTGHNISPTFLPFFQSRGNLDRFGYPRTEEFMEDGVLVQYFQKARLEYKPEFQGTAYEVQISLLGEWLIGNERPPRVEPFESSSDQRFFDETGHSVNFAFLRYFETRGGLDSFGFPVTEEFPVDGRPAQYFQRARLEYRAELAGRPDEVSVAFIGDEVLRARGWLD